MEPYRDDKGNRFAILDSLLLPGGETSTDRSSAVLTPEDEREKDLLF